MSKNVCIIDCGSEKTKEIIEIAERTHQNIDRWYLYYPTIKLKDNIKFTSENIHLLSKQDNKIICSNFDENFIAKYDYLILSGGGLLQEIQTKIKLFFSYLLKIKIPTLGICFGHQVIGLVYGSELYNVKEKVFGNFEVNFIKENRLITKTYVEHKYKFNKNHSEAITIAYEFDLLANSDSCKNEMMQHKSKEIYSTQFHPEVSGDMGEKIIENLLV